MSSKENINVNREIIKEIKYTDTKLKSNPPVSNDDALGQPSSSSRFCHTPLVQVEPEARSHLPHIHTSAKEDLSQSLEGMSLFENAMQEYYRHLEHLGKLFPILLAVKMNLFNTLESFNSGATPRMLMDKLGYKTPERRFIDLLDQLHFEGYLNRVGLLDKAVYTNSDYTKKCFLKNSIGNYPQIYNNLNDILRRFERFSDNISSYSPTSYWNDVFNTSENISNYFSFDEISNQFNFQNLTSMIDFSKCKKILILHGGRGQLAVMIKKSAPMTEVISFESSRVKSHTETYLTGLNMTDKVATLFGDVINEKLPEVDCIVCPNFLMHFNYSDRKEILMILYNRLSFNGELIIMETTTDNERTQNGWGSRMSFMMGSWEGFVSSYEEYKIMLHSIGFKSIECLPNKTHVMCDVILAKK